MKRQVKPIVPGPYYTLGPSGPQAFVDCTNGANWTCNHGACTTDTSVKFQGADTTCITVSGAQTSITVTCTSSIFPLACAGRMACAIMFENIAEAGSIQFEWGDSGFTNKFLRFPTNGQSGIYLREMSNQWETYPVDMTGGVVTGSPRPATCVSVRITFSFRDSNTDGMKIWIGAGVSLPPTRAQIMLTVDDGYTSWYTYLLDQAKLYGIPVTAAITRDYIGSGGLYISHADLIALLSDPAQLVTAVNHTATHTDLTTLTDPQAMADIALCNTYLQTLPKYYLPMIVYPYGAYSVALQQALWDAGYVLGREVGAEDRSLTPFYLDENLRSLIFPATANLTDTTSLAAAQQYVMNAVLTGNSAMLMAHRFHPTTASDVTWPYDRMTPFMAFLGSLKAQGLIQMPTAQEFYENLR